MALLMCDLLVEAGVIGAGDVSAQKLSAIVAKATSWRHHPQLTTKARRNPDRQSGHSRCAKQGLKFPRFRGHRNICVSGVRDVEETPPIPA